MDIQKYIESLPYGLKTTLTDGEIEVFHDNWENDHSMLFDVEDSKEHIDEQLNFLNYRYVKNYACYSDDYIEILILPSDVHMIDRLGSIEMDEHFGKLFYKISSISEIMENSILAYSGLDRDFTEYLDSYTSLKVFYPETHKVDPNKIDYQVKKILFELSYKHDIRFRLYSLPKEMDEVYDDDPYYDALEKLTAVKDNYTEREYDSDLLNYYYRANILVDNDVFKYLAYYQVLECIFNEVHLDDTVSDLRQIINSSWFSPQKTEDLTKLVEVVDQYNKSKNDRDKLKMVLEKYFKGTTHKEAFLLANKEITEIMKDKLHAINTEDELWDMQKLAGVIYDVRCESTHTDRTFLRKTKVQLEDDNIEHYISLVRKVSERVILNYY